MAHVLLASAARNASGSAVVDAKIAYALSRCCRAAFLLNVSAAATAVGDLLDVYIQTSIDGTNYDDLLRFTQVLGNGGVKKYVAYWQGEATPTTPLAAPTDGSMAAGVKQGPLFGATFRVKWTITSASAPNFTFDVSAMGVAD